MTRRLILFVVLVVSLGVACVWQQVHSLHLQYEIADYQKKVRKQKRKKRAYTTRLEHLQSMERLRKLLENEEVQFMRAGEDRVLNVAELRRIHSRNQQFASSRGGQE